MPTKAKKKPVKKIRPASPFKKTVASKLVIEPQDREDKHAELVAAVSEALKRKGDALEIPVPKGKTAEQWRNNVSSLIRRRLPSIPIKLCTLKGKRKIAIYRK